MTTIELVSERPTNPGDPPVPAAAGAGPSSSGVPIARLPVPAMGEE